MAENKFNYWFNSAKPVRFIVVDYRASLFLIVFLLHMRFYTFILLIFIFVFLWILEMNKLSVNNACKRLRVILAGKVRKRS
jgi:hypothetical protein